MADPTMATKLIIAVVWILFFFFFCFLNAPPATGVQILSKSKLDKCEKSSDSDNLNCTRKIILNLAVPTGSSGGEASLVAEIVEVEENSTSKMQTLRIPPVVTINKSAVYALYELMYIRDVPYKPQEYYVKTRKCEPDADAKVLQICERLQDENGHIIEHTQPVCCPCGPQRRIPSSCGNVFDKILKGKANTAHCLRFPGEWFHIFGIGQRSLGFSVRVEIKTGKRISEVIVGPENRTAVSNDKFLRVNLVGDFTGYSNIPSFEEFYLVIPHQGDPVQLKSLGTNFSMWMTLERVRFTLDGLECNKIGVSYEAFNGQPDFCSAPFWSCLHNQLWNFWEADQNRLARHQFPLYGIQGRFERINQHPNAGTHSFSIGITESLNTNLLIELSADDIEYVYQRSPGKIISVTVPTFEALTQSGIATITTKNTGEVEASYSLTFDCTSGITLMEEQFFIMKPNEVLSRSFKLYPSTDQAAKYTCAVILKDSDFKEVDRAECQFSTTPTLLDNGTQVAPFQPPKTGFSGFLESIKNIWNRFWEGVLDFVTGKGCRSKCSGFFDFSCHIQYICISWLLLFGLFLAIFPTALVLLWLLHQKGVFDPIYDWWEDHFLDDIHRDAHRHKTDAGHPHIRYSNYYNKDMGHRRHGTSHKRRTISSTHGHLDKDHDFNHYLHQVHKDKFKHRRNKHSSSTQQVASHGSEVDGMEHYKHRKERTSKGQPKVTRHGENKRHGHERHSHDHGENKQHEHERHHHDPGDDARLVLHHKRRR